MIPGDGIRAPPVDRADAARDAPLAPAPLEAVHVAQPEDHVGRGAVPRGIAVVDHDRGLGCRDVAGEVDVDEHVVAEVRGRVEAREDLLEEREESVDAADVEPVVVGAIGPVARPDGLEIEPVDAPGVLCQHPRDGTLREQQPELIVHRSLPRVGGAYADGSGGSAPSDVTCVHRSTSASGLPGP